MAIYLDKRIETVESIFAASAAGVVFVPVNPMLKATQVGHILGDCDVRVLVTTPEPLAAARGPSSPRCRPSSTWSLVGEARPEPARVGVTAARLRRAGRTDAGPPSDPDAVDLDMAAILYTSGSTGRPKGVVL